MAEPRSAKVLRRAADEPDRPAAPDRQPVADELEDHFGHVTVLRDSFDVVDPRW